MAEAWPAAMDARLRAAQVGLGAQPRQAWLRLREVEGRRATIVDLYELVAQQRGATGDQLPRAERAELANWALPRIWPGFSRTEGSERSDVDLVVVAYDPGWPAEFATWQGRLRRVLLDVAVRIEHVGSTAVPGLPAKPTIDVQVSVTDPDDEAEYVRQVQSTGLLLRSRDDLHRFFRPPADRPRTVHVHVCRAGSAWEREHLLFRDYLRTHSAARDAYAAAKADAAARWADDRIGYNEAKTGTILDLLVGAEAWAVDTGWRV